MAAGSRALQEQPERVAPSATACVWRWTAASRSSWPTVPTATTAYHYLYEHYDQAGRFYVVRTPAYEDFSYTLVMMRTGRLFTVYGTPVWSSDKSTLPDRRVLAAAGARQPRHTRARERRICPRKQKSRCPARRESCSARWDFQSWVSVTCTPREAGKKGTEFVVIRGNDGVWKRFGR